MKIRILGNSIRLRLTQTEVKNLSEKGIVEERTQFGPTPFEALIYSLMKTDDGEISATYDSNLIEVFLPEKMVDDWAVSDQVGLENNMPLGNGQSLHILVEKDFKCLTERDEDESDHFPNPAENC